MPTVSDSLAKSILEAAGLQNLTGAEAVFAVERILDDHWCLDQGWKAASRAFIVDALRSASFAQLETLRKRIQPAKPAAPVVAWAYTPANDTVSGVAFITATCGSETIHWSGDARKIHEVVFKGQHVPPETQYLYKLHAGIAPPDPDAIQQQRERIQWEQERQNRRQLVGEEVLVAEQEHLAAARAGK